MVITFVIFERDRATTCPVADITLYVPVVTLSTNDNAKLLEQLKSGFKRKINYNKYQSKEMMHQQNLYLDYLIDPCFREVNRLFVLSSENDGDGTGWTQYFLPKIEINDCNLVIYNLLYNHLKTFLIWLYHRLFTIFPLFQTTFNMIAIKLSKKQTLDADPKGMQQTNFTENLERNGNKTKCFIIGNAKETNFDFSGGIVRVLQFYFALIQNGSI